MAGRGVNGHELGAEEVATRSRREDGEVEGRDDKMNGVKGGGRCGQTGMGRLGTRHRSDPFVRRLMGHQRSLSIELPLRGSCRSRGGVPAVASLARLACSLREHGASGSPGSGSSGLALELARQLAPGSLPPRSRIRGPEYRRRCVCVAGVGREGELNE